MSRTFNIIYMGTPEFAVPALEALGKSKHSVSLVVTQPDRPCGRGCKVLPPPVKQSALDLGLEVLQPESVKTDDFFETMGSYNPDLFVVVAFGRILPKTLLSLPELGAVNIHASLLPKYRGPAPIQWAIINGEKQTGVTTMFMDEGMDTGDILSQKSTEISGEDTAATLHNRLARMGAELLMETLACFEQGNVRPTPQDHQSASVAPLLKKNDGRIGWQKSAETISAFVRGMTPWPGAFTFHGDKRLKIFKVKTYMQNAAEPPGTVIRGFSGELRIAAGKGIVSVLEIQGASGKRLPVADFLRGYQLKPGDVLK